MERTLSDIRSPSQVIFIAGMFAVKIAYAALLPHDLMPRYGPRNLLVLARQRKRLAKSCILPLISRAATSFIGDGHVSFGSD